MSYLIAQIFVCLLLAALLGGLVGWLLRGRGRADAAAADALAVANRRIETLEHELRPARMRSRPSPARCADGGLAASAAGRITRDEPAPPPADL